MERLQQRDSGLSLGNLQQIAATYEAMSRNQAAYHPGGKIHCPITLVQAEAVVIAAETASDAEEDWD